MRTPSRRYSRPVRLNCEVLEDRLTPAASIFGQAFGTGATPAVAGAIPDAGGATQLSLPYSTATGVRVALGDVTGDQTTDLVTVPTVGAPLVKVFDGVSGGQVASFLAFSAGTTLSATVAVGDLNNDTFADIVVGTTGGPGIIFAFSGRTLGQLGTFLPFGGAPTGVNVAIGDVDGDGQLDIIAGTATGLAVVGVYSGQTFAQKQLFLPFGQFTAGVTLATGDLDGDNTDEIIIGTAGFVPAFAVNKGAVQTTVFFPFGAPPAGVNVAVNDVNGDGRFDIVAGLTTGLAVAGAYDGSSLATINTYLPFGTFAGGVFVA